MPDPEACCAALAGGGSVFHCRCSCGCGALKPAEPWIPRAPSRCRVACSWGNSPGTGTWTGGFSADGAVPRFPEPRWNSGRRDGGSAAATDRGAACMSGGAYGRRASPPNSVGAGAGAGAAPKMPTAAGAGATENGVAGWKADGAGAAAVDAAGAGAAAAGAGAEAGAEAGTSAGEGPRDCGRLPLVGLGEFSESGSWKSEPARCVGSGIATGSGAVDS